MLQDLDIIKAYYAMFARAPEKEGFDFWKSAAATNNWNLPDLVHAFLSLPVVHEAGYPPDQTPESYVANLYATLFGKAPDDDGFWAGALRSGVSRGDLLSSMVQAALGTADGTPGKANLINKLAFSEYVVSIQEASNVNLDYNQLITWTGQVNATVESVTTTIQQIANAQGGTLNLFPHGTTPTGSSAEELTAAILNELNIFQNAVMGSGSSGNGGGTGTGGTGVDGSTGREFLATDMAQLTGLVTFNTYGGVLSTESLRSAALSQLANDSDYDALFNPNSYAGYGDGTFTAAEIGVPGLSSFSATTENLESLYYGTVIQALKAIDMSEALEIDSFIQINGDAILAGDEAVLSQYMQLMVDVFADPAATPILSDAEMADAITQGTVLAAQLVGSGDPLALFDGMLTPFV